MRRATRTFLLVIVAAPAAQAWVPCDQPGIEPPVALHREAPAYPPAVREIGVEGSVEVALTVLRDGTVGWVRALRGEPPGFFEQAAVAGARAWRFRPARADGAPIECRLVTHVRFALVDTVDVRTSSSDRGQPVPAYPPKLLLQRIEGYVEVVFDRAADGSIVTPGVISAMPRGPFEAAALEAIRRWRLDPGSARRETRRFEFRLPDSTLAAVPAIVLASAPFPMEACEQNQSGRVTLEVQTDAQGTIGQARILSATPRGLFDSTALTIARASRLTPAYRDGQPMAAIALLTLFFDPAQATCPGVRTPERDPPPVYRPAPRVTGTTKGPTAAPTG
jgi:TonB family protein